MKTPVIPPTVSSRKFGKLEDGRSVEAWTLQGSGGLEIEILTYGGIVSRLLAPDSSGHFGDMVLGYKTLDEYLDDRYFFGATAGRIAGRVTNGELMVEGEIFKLPINDPPNHLHGGSAALNTKLWKVERVSRCDKAPSIKLSYCSPDGEQGYPGTVDVSVVYTVTDDNTFIFETFAQADRTTPVSLTHHSYFNLAGEGCGDITNHQAQIYSDQTVASDTQMTLLDRLEHVAGRAADLREPKQLGNMIPRIWQSHGDLYCLAKNDAIKLAARVTDPNSGRMLEVHTTQSYMQTYFGAALDGSLSAKSTGCYLRYGGFCLECQGYPNATNVTDFGDTLVHPGKVQHHTTIYAFGVDD